LTVWAVAAVNTLGAQAPTSVLQGVYTKEQAKRGEAVYAETCASCHGSKLEGGEMAPALAGPDFQAGWAGKQTVNDLFVKVHQEMPQDNPGTLTPEQAADAVAFVLAGNKYPAGKTELTKDGLKAIKIEAPK
jgi:mono/diheme cytochrome c family protein